MITRKTESKTLAKHILCEYKCRFDGRKCNQCQINGGITINVDVSLKKVIYVQKNHFCNPATCICENGKYLTSMMNNSAIMCDEVIESYDEETKLF